MNAGVGHCMERLVSTQENYPWNGTDKKVFICLVSSGLEKFSSPFQSTDNFPEWKLAFSLFSIHI
jgi:hypothetical protein